MYHVGYMACREPYVVHGNDEGSAGLTNANLFTKGALCLVVKSKYRFIFSLSSNNYLSAGLWSGEKVSG